MAGTLGPRDLTTYGYAIGESGWGVATNTSLQTLDALTQLSVQSTTTTAPPSLGASDEGKAYVIPSGATGAWSGLTGQIAVWDGAAWDYYNPAGASKTWINWTVWDYSTKLYWVYGGTVWAVAKGQTQSGTYASRPAATTAYTGVHYNATDIGIGGAIFYCDGSTWKHVGVTRLFNQYTNVSITTTAETSIFGTGQGALTLPSGCVGQGTTFNWSCRVSCNDAQTAHADIKFKAYIGSTAVGDTGSVDGIYGTNAMNPGGQTTCKTTGASGTALGSIFAMTSYNQAPNKSMFTTTATATTVDTTGAISPDVKITLANLVNTPTISVVNSCIDVAGLV
ncbi:MAG: DUF2793 domain-containing protein [Chloroflexi bacterium]|nr:DUF2793 domain-containing protein [Chloroflexota bacterium]